MHIYVETFNRGHTFIKTIHNSSSRCHAEDSMLYDLGISCSMQVFKIFKRSCDFFSSFF